MKAAESPCGEATEAVRLGQGSDNGGRHGGKSAAGTRDPQASGQPAKMAENSAQVAPLQNGMR